MASYYFANNPRNAEGNEAYVAAVWHYDFDVGFPIDLPLLQLRLANVPWARTFKHRVRGLRQIADDPQASAARVEAAE
jgi:hypothetical protein